MTTINQLISEIGIISVKSVPPDSKWDKIVFSINILITYSENTTEFYNKEEVKGTLGRYTDEHGKRISSSNTAWQLREEMYRESSENGAWYFMEMTILPEGKFHIQFNYDNRPEFSIPLDDSDFVKDYQKFPRSNECMPEWLREIIERNQIS